MEEILNFAAPLNVPVLDAVVQAVYMSANAQERSAAQKVLAQFQEHPDAWTRVAQILEFSQNSNTKYFGLQILESVIKYRWKVLPKEQRDGIKQYIVNLIIKLSSDPNILVREKVFIGKLDVVLVQIIKQEWPQHWENFIPEIVGASRANESLCENNMTILRLMSEEVFDFSSGQMTHAKINQLKASFNKEFSQIFTLCEFILDNSQKPSLLLVTLKTLLRFLNWIPLGYIFETKLVDTLILKFLPTPVFRTVTLECLTEIASLEVGLPMQHHIEKLYLQTLNQLRSAIPIEQVDIAAAYENGSEDEQNFIHRIALFFCGIFRAHPNFMESPDHQPALLEGHMYLVKISFVDDVEIFKICLEYWNKLASDLYHETSLVYPTNQSLMLGSAQPTSPRRQLYALTLSKVRVALIRNMPRPEEVLIVEDENGEIVRETMKDSDAITLYKSMRETLVFLTHLDYEDTQVIMLEKLAKQVDGSEWSWNNLNTLCWAIGAISGAQNEEYEKRFLVTVIKDLLGMCEMKRGKDNKAVIASNIMYVVGQYPRFLRAHWKFLKTVVNKLFEFMHESHPGVQDMACDTFLKIAQKCRRKFVVHQVGERVPFIEEILSTLPQIISDLEPSQIQTFYEAIGYMIQSNTDAPMRDALVAKLMELPNQSWSEIMAQAAKSIEYLKIPDTIKNIANILKVNVRACLSLGHYYISQLSRIYLDMLNVYKAYSEMISGAVAANGVMAARTSLIRTMRTVKKETLRLIQTFIERSEDPALVANNFIPPLLEAVLGDYKANIPESRDPEVLSVMAAIINKLQGAMTKEVPRIFNSVFECTLEMITKNFQDYPEHRLYFFNLLRAIDASCFQVFFTISPAHFKLVIDSIVWAFKHTERNISETGLNILLEMLQNVSNAGPDVSSIFYKTYFLPILQDVFFVLTDTFHKSGFKLQATILLQCFNTVESGKINVPLWDPAAVSDPSMTNQKFLREYVINLLSNAFKNLSSAQIRSYILGLFDMSLDLPAFKKHLRDFLVQLKEFSGDNEDLYLEEKEAAMNAARAAEQKRAQSIPGLIPQSALPEEQWMGD
eukprot:TRINITY_DN5522_c0_g1_i1.p1 TRINITY_DN5522_c0_g1~~TRINITY_DN5522_c0_g1_i1.p1  ORF type:complete len:1069 (+),score=345.41 TRINITY_DN5522_c0_g1_i1:320-3526(+)